MKDHDFLLRSFTPEYMGRSPGLAESVAAVRADHPERPFFYAQHRTIPGTCRFRDHLWGAEDGAGDCRRVLDGCPDGVAFFGHTHSSLADEQSAWQGGFSAINAGGFVNAAVPRGRENSAAISWLADDPAPFAQMPSVPANTAHDAMIVTVDGWRLRVERLDVETGLPLGPDWSIETGPEAIARGAFGNAARAASAGPPPQFSPDAAITVEDVPDGANRSGAPVPQVRVRFPRAELAAPGPLRFTVAPANAWGQEGAPIAFVPAP